MKALVALMIVGVGRLMNPGESIPGGASLPFAIATESDQYILTEDNQILVTEAAP